MPLEKYRARRRFSKTPEPKGKKAAARRGWRFVVQKHAARRLHYDFRLELDGVFKSWAVPKGPSLDPAEKRLAVHVEDHPLEYGDFEGVIPEGEYGGGTVVLWDRGTWSTEEDAQEAYRNGKLKFQLAGEKLHGGWTLVRMKSKPGERSENWLLIKERDDQARPLSEFDVLDDQPNSVATGRTLGQITADKNRTWHSNRATGKGSGKAKKPAAGKPKRKPKGTSPKALAGAVAASFPEFVPPQLATRGAGAPTGDQWFHEIKFDGYRLQCHVNRGRARLLTRNRLDWTTRFSEIAEAAADLPCRQAVLDGEVVALLPNGVSSFQALQDALSAGHSGQLVYQVFDLLYLDGYDLTGVLLDERKSRLAELLRDSSSSRLQYTDHIEGHGPEFLQECCRLGLEGVVSKQRNQPYRGGRTSVWVKSKCIEREEFVVGGFTNPTGARQGFGALLLGYHDKKGRLIYAGRVGTGFSDRMLLELRDRLRGMETSQNPFANLTASEAGRGVHWVAPQLVAQVEFGNWTGDGILRHPSFNGLREDIPASAVVRNGEPVTK